MKVGPASLYPPQRSSIGRCWVPLQAFVLLLAELYLSYPAFPAPPSPAIQAEIQRVEGASETVLVPAVTEPWSATAGPSLPRRNKIVHPIGHFPGFREAKAAANAKARLNSRASRSTQTLSLLASSGPTVFDGPSEFNTQVIPPDPVVAAGPSHVVVLVNSLMAIYDKAGALQGGFQDLAGFFSNLGFVGDVSDPRIIYDQTDNRFILSVGQIDFFNFSTGNVLVAVSQTSDPTGMWNKFAVNFKGRNLANTANTFPDFPSLGLSPSAIYISSNQYILNSACLTADSCLFSDSWIKVIGLPELISGNPTLNITTFKNVKTASGAKAYAIQPALTYGTSAEEFFVAANFSVYASTKLNVFAINTSGVAALSAADLTVPSFSQPPDAPQAGTSTRIATNDFRLLNAVWINNSLWFAQNVADDTGASAVGRWYEISASSLSSLAVNQTGTVSGLGNAYYPALAINSVGDTEVAFTTSSATQFASAAYTGRAASDLPNTMRTPVLFRAGASPYVDFAIRWGDYSGASLDPDGSTVWMIAEYASSYYSQFGTVITRATEPPALSLTAVSLDFGNQDVGTPSAAQSITLTNNSANSVTISSVTFTGFNPGDFSITSDSCSGVTLNPNQSCSISVTFAPTVFGPRMAQMAVTYVSSGGLQTSNIIPLSGFGGSTGVLTASPTSLTFPDTPLRTSSAPQTVTLTNTGNETLSIFGFDTGSDFVQTNTCIPAGSSKGTLVVGGKCTVSVIFRPTSAGSLNIYNVYISVRNNTANPYLYIQVYGNGIIASGVTFCPGNVTFAGRTVGTTSAPQQVALSNTGSADLTVTKIAVTGDFAQTNDCASSLSARTACIINVTFTPSASGTRTGTLTVTDNAAGSPQGLALAGTGVAAAATLFAPAFAPAVNLVSGVRPEASGTDRVAPLASAPGPNQTVFRTEQAARARIERTYGRLPLSFEINQGQSDPQVQFLTRAGGHTLFLTSDGAVLSFRAQRADLERKIQSSEAGKLGARVAGDDGTGTKPPPEYGAVLGMRLVGANPASRAEGVDELPGRSNYFVGSDPKMWRANVPNYARVLYRNMYPGVDLLYYGNQGQLEYDFVVAPGADPRSIRLHIQGARNVQLDSSGDLVLEAGSGDIRLRKPVVYQRAGTRVPRGEGGAAPIKHLLEGRYVLRDRQEVTFDVASYDSSEPLIIDPVLSYSNYLGGTGGDQAFAIAVDASGSAYVTGLSQSSDFPTTSGAFQTGFGGTWDAFVTKLSPDGSSLVYSTYLGGSDADQGTGIAVDAAGNAYVAGFTSSINFPTLNSIQSSLAGKSDAFLTKLDPSGSLLVYSTYLGGSGDDRATGVAADLNGDAYVTGTTNSFDMPHTSTAFQPFFASWDSLCAPTVLCNDAFVTKINPSGSAFIYSTFLGGSEDDRGQGIGVDAAGNAYVAGVTHSPDFPTTPGAFQTGYGGNTDAFVTKLSPDGVALVYSTYLGGGVNSVYTGNGEDIGQAIVVDSVGSAYVTGSTGSGDFPLTTTLQSVVFGTFVAKLHPAGCALNYSVRFDASQGLAIAVNNAGNAYVAGQTNSPGLPVAQPVQSTCASCASFYNEGFVVELNTIGTGFVYATYLGGSNSDSVQGVAVDPSGNTYVAGFTYSPDFPTTPSAFQTAKLGYGSAYVTKISPADGVGVYLPTKSLTFTDQAVGSTSPPAGVTLRNVGSGTLTASLAISGDFSQTNNCGTVPGGGRCTIQVTFSPKVSGTRAGVITITDNAPDSPQTISLTGTGVDAPYVVLSATSLIFGDQTDGTTSAGQPLALTNIGNRDLSITGIAVKGDFSQTNNCGSHVAGGASCSLNVVFTPTYPFERFGTITITDNAAGSPHTVNLKGTGLGAILYASTFQVYFGNQAVGTTSPPQAINLSSGGNAPLTITSITVPADYNQANNCPSAPLAPGTYCTVTLSFTPTALGPKTGSLDIVSNAANGSPSLPVSGTGVVRVLILSPTSLDFGNEVVGSTSNWLTVTVNNTSSRQLTLSSLTLNGDFVLQNNSCGSTVYSQGWCYLSLAFKPSAAGARTGSLVVTDDTDPAPSTIQFAGVGQDFEVSVSPPSATISAGQSASFTLTLIPDSGFDKPVSLGCSGLPRYSSCSASPYSVTLDGINPASATVKVTTTARSMTPRSRRVVPPPLPLGGVSTVPFLIAWFLGLAAAAAARRAQRRRVWLGLGLIILLALLWLACGGGGGGNGGGGSPGTPPGTYTLTVSGTYVSSSGKLQHDLNLTLTVN